MGKTIITVNCPDGDFYDYFENLVVKEISQEYTSGHVDSETNWKMEKIP